MHRLFGLENSEKKNVEDYLFNKQKSEILSLKPLVGVIFKIFSTFFSKFSRFYGYLQEFNIDFVQ